jgi:hypothetical protein
MILNNFQRGSSHKTTTTVNGENSPVIYMLEIVKIKFSSFALYSYSNSDTMWIWHEIHWSFEAMKNNFKF